MHKLTILFSLLTLSVGLWAETVSYLYPVYNTDGVAASGIKEWKTDEIEATVVTSNTNAVLWSAGWYVVTGVDVTLTKGAICTGAVHLILADGAKLTATGIDDFTPGIQVSGEGNSLTIYSQNNQSGQLIAKGALAAAGIGGGSHGSGSNITINGGIVETTGGTDASGIGGGKEGSASDIFVATNLVVRAGLYNPPTTVIENTGADLASSLAGKQYVTIKFDLSRYKVDAILEIRAASEGIQNTEMNNWIHAAFVEIPDAATIEEVDRIKNQILPMIQLFQDGKAEGKAELLGTMGEPCDGCTIVEVSNEETTVTLYNPKKVKYRK